MKPLRYKCALGAGLLALALGGACPSAQAQGNVGTGTALLEEIANAYLVLDVGVGSDASGSIGLYTTPNNPNDPLPAGSATTNYLLVMGLLNPANSGPFNGTHLYIRVNGGLLGGGGGGDYVWGDPLTGNWVVVPTIRGAHLEASWATKAVVVASAGGTGGGDGGLGSNGGTGSGGNSGNTGGTGNGGGTGTTTGTINDPQIEVKLVASFVHDQVRFQFTINNQTLGSQQSVGLAFVEDAGTTVGFNNGAPVRLPGLPYLRRETLLYGNQIPQYFESYQNIGTVSASNTANIRSVRGTLRPATPGQLDPTPPTRFAYGSTNTLNGTFYIDANGVGSGTNNGGTTVTRIRLFDRIWNFQPNTAAQLDQGTTSPNTAVAIYWDPQPLAPSQSRSYSTYFGQATSDTYVSAAYATNGSVTPLAALSVNSPLTTPYITSTTTTGTGTGTTTTGRDPRSFRINAYVTNLSDAGSIGNLDIGPVNLALSLPPGLILDPVTANQTLNKTVSTIGAGAEGAVFWDVIPNTDLTTNPTGSQTYSVTFSPNLPNTGGIVQRTVDIPSPTILKAVASTVDQNLFQMISLPIQTGTRTPSQLLGLTSNQFVLVRWDPTRGSYETVTRFVPGQGYWFQNTSTKTTFAIPVDATNGVGPISNQLLPGASPYKIEYQQGWNQIGNPFILPVRFSEIQVFDAASLSIAYADEAANTQHNWLLPAIYRYNVTTQDYELITQSNFGFTLNPFDAYWIKVQKPSLQFIYPGVDVPGASISTRGAARTSATHRAVTVANSPNNGWELPLVARSVSFPNQTRTVTVGVAQGATDGMDAYKYDKPPVPNPNFGLDIVHTSWDANSRFIKDLRPTSRTRKVWDVMVRSNKPNESVTLTWPGLGSIPRNTRLTLVDTNGNVSRNLRNMASYTVSTGQNGTRSLQIVAEPNSGANSLRIVNFAVTPGAGTRASGASAFDLHYTLSGAANAQVFIKDGRGRILRSVPMTRAVGDANSGDAHIELRDSKGSILPSGLYNIELVAQGEGSEVARQILPLPATRF